MRFTCLGIAGGFVSADQNTQSYFLEFNNSNLLFDASEGAAISLNNISIDTIFISHIHMDHISGLPQIILNHINNNFQIPIIYAPSGSQQFITNFFSLMNLEVNINIIQIDTILQNIDYKISTIELFHVVECYGIRIETSKNKLIYILSDGDYSNLEILESVPIDYLICECTFTNLEKAKQFKHSNDTIVRQLVDRLNVQNIIIGHFSLRLKNNFKPNLSNMMDCFQALTDLNNITFLCQNGSLLMNVE
eukprot:EST42683.1 Ribonuclease BN [Spironucleus salmonicida]